MQPGRMLEMARIDGFPWLRAGLLALFGALILAASAHAEPVAGGEGSPEVQEIGGTSPTETQQPAAGRSAPGADQGRATRKRGEAQERKKARRRLARARRRPQPKKFPPKPRRRR